MQIKADEPRVPLVKIQLRPHIIEDATLRRIGRWTMGAMICAFDVQAISMGNFDHDIEICMGRTRCQHKRV